MDIRLVIFREDGSRRDFVIKAGLTTIGRKQDCTIRIPLHEVSRRHAEIQYDEETEEVVLKDLGAANGTFLNNSRIDEDDLQPGDHIMIGPVVFTVQIDGDPPDDEIVKIRTKIQASQRGGSGSSVATSKHVYVSEDEVDPIAALEALASSTDQTAIEPDEDEDED